MRGADRFLDWTGSKLPSLSHPLYAAEPTDEGSLVPAFPELRSGWLGAFLPSITSVALNMRLLPQLTAFLMPEFHELRKVPGLEDLKVRAACVTLEHEGAHLSLAGALIPAYERRLQRVLLLHLLDFLQGASKEWEGVAPRKLTVPLVPDINGHFFEIGWRQLLDLNEAIAPVEEVFAVWDSLRVARAQRLITESERRRLEGHYKASYGLRIVGFSRLYDVFKAFADKVDPKSAQMLATVSLMTPESSATMRVLLDRFGQTLVRQGSMDSHLLDQLMQIIYRRNNASVKRRPELWQVMRLWYDRGDRSAEWHLDVAAEQCHFYFDEKRTSLAGTPVDDDQAVEGSMIRHQTLILLESIRQQMTMGVGLVCPFWKPGYCCERQDLLDRVLQETTGQAATWTRRGCLTDA